MRVMKPSTCGWMSVDRRDFTVPTNSVICSTGFASRVIISTGMGGIAPGGGPAGTPGGALAPAARYGRK